MSVGIEISVLDDLVKFFDELPDVAEQAAVLAINDVTEREGMTAIRNEMRSQVDFPKGYLESDRLKVRRKAYKGSLEAIKACLEVVRAAIEKKGGKFGIKEEV